MDALLCLETPLSSPAPPPQWSEQTWPPCVTPQKLLPPPHRFSPDWIPFTRSEANRRLRGAWPRGLHAWIDMHTHTHTQFHPCSDMNCCLWLDIKRHFFFPLHNKVAHETRRVKSNHMFVSQTDVWRIHICRERTGPERNQ